MNNQKGLASITIVLILIAVIGGGILTWQQWGPFGIKFKYQIKNCKETEKLSPLKSLYEPEEFEIGSVNHSIFVKGFISSYCNMKPMDNLYMTYLKKKNEIIFKIITDPKGGMVAKCVCWFFGEGELKNLPSGKYQVKIIRENKYVNKISTVLVKEVQVK
jgi:hypothetical protein